MEYRDGVYHLTFAHSGVTSEIPFSSLHAAAVEFLEHYGGTTLLGEAFCAVVGEGAGETRFARLLEASGYPGDAEGFFAELLAQLEVAHGRHREPIMMNDVILGHLFVMEVLERVLPGEACRTVQDVGQLERLTNVAVPVEERENLQEVIDTYPVRLSMHTVRQAMVSKAVAYQYLPFVEELDPVGHVNTWIGQFHQGLLEQMYQNRVIFLLNMTCPVYCRFCFRKHKESRNRPNPTLDEVREAVKHIGRSESVKEIVLTGGDPFLNKANLSGAIDGLMEIPHVQTLRLATRSIAYHPHFFLADDRAWLNYLKVKHLELRKRGKRLEIATHFIHPDEVSPQSLDIIAELVRAGIPVYVQTPFLGGCNDRGPELARLFSLLRGAGAELHYIYIPCSPIHGNSIYWTPISTGLDAGIYLRAHLSDRAIPRICTATPIGKMDWHTSGWAVEQDRDSESFIWIRSPYTPEYFNAFAPGANELDVVRVNSEGTLDVKYMARIGNPNLLLGRRKPREKPPWHFDAEALRTLQSRAFEDQRLPDSIVATGSEAVRRVHETRVEMDPETAGDPELAYLARETKITDVVLAGRRDAVDALSAINALIRRLQEIPHINVVRLRSLKFNAQPESYGPAVLDALRTLNRLSVANPLRLEIETQFLHFSELTPYHARLAAGLRQRGITVYSNTPLLAGINDSPGQIHRIAHRCRDVDLEFHHLYVAGLPLQDTWNRERPIALTDVLDIATRVRREGSGREIPRYIIHTPLGEVDFGLSSRFIQDDGRLWVTLLPYTLEYYREMDPGFQWPSGVRLTPEGRPQVAVEGMTASEGFMLAAAG